MYVTSIYATRTVFSVATGPVNASHGRLLSADPPPPAVPAVVRVQFDETASGISEKNRLLGGPGQSWGPDRSAHVAA